MSAQDWWQENKLFALATAGGGVVFLIGVMLVQTFYGDDLAKARRSVDLTNRKLGSESMYGKAARDEAEARNQALQQAVTALKDAVHFVPRPFWSLDAKRGTASSQYFAAVAATREDLLQRAGRANARIPEELGLPALSPTKDGEIERYLAALDLVDRAVRTALAQGVARVDRIDIRLDPRLGSKDGVGRIEKTRVLFALSGAPKPLVDFLAATQDPSSTGGVEGGAPLTVEKVELAPARNKADEAALEVVFIVARVERAE